MHGKHMELQTMIKSNVTVVKLAFITQDLLRINWCVGRLRWRGRDG
jgi:hypothetical protein